MGTRLKLEYAVKERFPHFRYVRIRTSGRNHAVIYAWDNDLQLSERDASALRRYACDGLSSYVCFGVKPYEYVPKECGPTLDIPDSLRQAAMSISSQSDIFSLLGNLVPGVGVAFNRYDEMTGQIFIHVYGHGIIRQEDKAKLEQYAEELIPVGSEAKLVYYE